MAQRSTNAIVCIGSIACMFGALGIGSLVFALKNPPMLRRDIATWYIVHDAPGSSGFHLVRELKVEDGLPVGVVAGGLEERGKAGLADFNVPVVISRDFLTYTSTKDFEPDGQFKSFETSPLIEAATKELAVLKDTQTTLTWPPQTVRRTQYTVYWPGVWALVGLAGAFVALLVAALVFVLSLNARR